MENDLKLTPRKGDLLAAAAVLLLALGITLLLLVRASRADRTFVQIYRDGELVKEVSLQTEQSFSVSGDYTNTVTVKDGKIAVTHSDCPGADCVHSGWISRAGQSIVCLPNRTEIRLVGEKTEDGIDAVAG